MKIADIPVKMPTPFASGATAPYITNPIPTTSQIGVSPGRASFPDGFPPLTFTQLAAGGDPPWGADFNGLLYMITSWLRWAAAGGLPDAFDATFAASIGGYPQCALLRSTTFGHYWISTVDDNPTNPDAGGANWTAFPDALIQIQANNYAVDTGIINQVTITFGLAPASYASIIGSPIRFKANHANSIVNPTININGLGAATIINSNGTQLGISQISRAGQICEGYLDGDPASGGKFQLTSPQLVPGGASAVVTGVIYEWPAEIAPSWGLECNGAVLNISDYPNLFNVIKSRFGGDGINTFALPDKRGAFTRGWDHGRGLDPNASTRTNSGNGTVGDHVGTWQGFATNFTGTNLAATLYDPLWYFIPKGFTVTDPFFGPYSAGGGNGGGGGSGDEMFGNANGYNDPTGEPHIPAAKFTGTLSFSGGAAETRPVNIDMMYVIAF